MSNREERLLQIHSEMRDRLKVNVKIDHDELLKLVVKDLIKKRKFANNSQKESFDIVLKYYLGNSDFEKYVIREKKIK